MGHPEAVSGGAGGGGAGGPVEENLDYEFATGGELVIDVIPTSASKRSHSAGVALRGAVDSKVGHDSDHDLDPSEKTYS